MKRNKDLLRTGVLHFEIIRREQAHDCFGIKTV